jgi:thiol-disulfide isomerase/thioredoxin
MRRVEQLLAAVVLVVIPSLYPPRAKAAQSQNDDAMKQALSQGDLYASKRKYELALEAYHKADKAAHHNSAVCYLKLASVERKLGDLSAALDDTKKAVRVAGDDKAAAIQAHMQRASLLVQMSGKPTDKKLKEAESELRESLALDGQKPLARFNLGVVLLKQERDEEGLKELNSCLTMPGIDSSLESDARRFIAAPIRARAPFAPDFSFTTRQNATISNAAMRGKVVLLDFWGTWCPPCRESVPLLRNLNKKFTGKAFQLVGVSSDDDEDVWRTFTEAQKMDWQQYIDLSGNVLESFKIESFPTYIVLDKDGVIRFRQSGLGPSTESEVEEAISKALKKESDPKLAAAMTNGSETAADSPARASGAPADSRPVAQPIAVSKTSTDSQESEPLEGVEASSIANGVYRNQELGMTYELPKNWVAATPSAIHAINEKNDAAAKAAILQQHPEMASSFRLSTTKIVLYASARGNGDGQHMSIPCMRITAQPSRVDTLAIENFQHMVELMAKGQALKILREPAEFEVQQHSFLRADFERSAGGGKAYEAYVQTLAGDYLLTIQFFATSADDLARQTESLKTMLIRDSE